MKSAEDKLRETYEIICELEEFTDQDFSDVRATILQVVAMTGGKQLDYSKLLEQEQQKRHNRKKRSSHGNVRLIWIH